MERDIAVLEQHWIWRAPTAGYSMMGAYLGRLLLTDRRLLFLSTGSNAILAQAFGGIPHTDHLDKSALANPGSLSLHLERVQSCAIMRRADFAKFLVVRTNHEAYSFMSKYGFRKGQLVEFQQLLGEQRAAVLAAAITEDDTTG